MNHKRWSSLSGWYVRFDALGCALWRRASDAAEGGFLAVSCFRCALCGREGGGCGGGREWKLCWAAPNCNIVPSWPPLQR